MMKENKSIEWTLISRLFGIVVFFTIIYLMGFIAKDMENPVVKLVTEWLTEQTALILVVFLIYLAAEIFNTVDFPVNLFSSLFNSIASIFLVSLLIELLILVDQLADMKFFTYLSYAVIPLQIIVASAVLITSYNNLISEVHPKEKEEFFDKIPFFRKIYKKRS